MSKRWFGVNKVWGWYPTSWEGWLVLSAMTVSIASTVYVVASSSESVWSTLIVIFPFVCLILAFTMFVASMKGSPPKFGSKESHSKNYTPDAPRAYLALALLTIPALLYFFWIRDFLSGTILLIVFCLLYLVYSNLRKYAD